MSNAPRLRVQATSARHEKRAATQLNATLASIIKSKPHLTPIQAMWEARDRLLDQNPNQPPKDGKCVFNELPDEIIGQIFATGVLAEEEEFIENIFDSEEEWETDEDEDDDEAEDDDDDDIAPKVKKALGSKVDKQDTLNVLRKISGGGRGKGNEEVIAEEGTPKVPFQVLVSHVCKRWRSVALGTAALWTTIIFDAETNLDRAKAYVERSGTLPLWITIDSTIEEDTDEEDHPDHPLYETNQAVRQEQRERRKAKKENSEDAPKFLSQQDVEKILDIVEPAVDRWSIFTYQASTYGYISLLLSRLEKVTSAAMLENLELFHVEECEDYETFSGDDKTAYLPFGGNTPNLRRLVLWGVHVDWERAVPTQLLSNLKELELSFHAKDVRPTYANFAKILKNSSELTSVQLSLSGPQLPASVDFDADESEGGWGLEPLEVPSVLELGLGFHEVPYAIALAQHFDFSSVRDCRLDFEEEDYTEFVKALAKPVKGKKKSLLATLETLKISALPCDIQSAELLLTEASQLKAINIKVVSPSEDIILQKLGDPSAGREDIPATSSSSLAPLPKLFLPNLQNLTLLHVDGHDVKTVIENREKLGAPKLKKLLLADSANVEEEDEEWLAAHVDEIDFYDPSESEYSDDEDPWVDFGDDDDDEDEDEDDEDDDDDDGAEPFPSPFAHHLGRPSRPRRLGRDLD